MRKIVVPAAIILCLAVSCLIGLKATARSRLLPLINQSFALGLICLLAGAVLIVLRSGFFAMFASGMKQHPFRTNSINWVNVNSL